MKDAWDEHLEDDEEEYDDDDDDDEYEYEVQRIRKPVLTQPVAVPVLYKSTLPPIMPVVRPVAVVAGGTLRPSLIQVVAPSPGRSVLINPESTPRPLTARRLKRSVRFSEALEQSETDAKTKKKTVNLNTKPLKSILRPPRPLLNTESTSMFR